jgi:DNA-directed RNA polymerase specialized sigma24 family protein
MEVDTRSEAAIYEAYAPELVRFATGLVGPADSPDVVADAFVALMHAPVWADAVNHRALLYRRVLFEARSWVRSAERRRSREDRAHPSTTVDFPDLRPDVAVAVAKLSPQQRAAVVLTYWQDLTPAAVAGSSLPQSHLPWSPRSPLWRSQSARTTTGYSRPAPHA